MCNKTNKLGEIGQWYEYGECLNFLTILLIVRLSENKSGKELPKLLLTTGFQGIASLDENTQVFVKSKETIY